MKKTLFVLLSVLMPTASSLYGQTVTTPTLQVTDDPNATFMTDDFMGSTGNALGAYLFTNQYGETMQIRSIDFFDSTTSTLPAATNLRLVIGNTPINNVAVLFAGAKPGGFGYIANFVVPQSIPAASAGIGGSTSIALLGDTPTYSSGATQDDSVHRFQVTGVVATGISSNQAASALAFAYGVPIRILRSTLSFGILQSTTTGATMLFSASGNPVLNKLALTVVSAPQDKMRTETLPADSTTSLNDVSLLCNGNEVTALGVAAKVVSGNTITWVFNPGFALQIIQEFQVTAPGSLRLSIVQATDLAFTTSTDPTGIVVNLSADNFPRQITGRPYVNN